MTYEVVCTKSYFDVGLLIETNNKLKPKRVLARASKYGSDAEYGGVENLTWIKTGVFLSKDDWIRISCDKGTDDILRELRINKEAYMEKWIEILDGCYPDGFPKNIYKHESCEPVNKAYPFCPYCGKKITYIKLINDSLRECKIGLFESKGFICE